MPAGGFTGVGGDPTVVSAAGQSDTVVRVGFSEPMEDNAALSTPGNYVFTPGGGSVAITATLVTPEVSATPTYVDVTVDVEMTIGSGNYTVEVSNVEDQAGNPIDTANDTAVFDGTGTQPQVTGASALLPDMINVQFSEDVKQVSAANPDDALNPTNYSVTGSSSPSVTAVVSTGTDSVRLTVGTALVDPGAYTVTVTNVEDLVNNVVDPANDDASFATSSTDPPQIKAAINVEAPVTISWTGTGTVNGGAATSPFVLSEPGLHEVLVINGSDVFLQKIVVLDAETIEVFLERVRTSTPFRELKRLKELLADGFIYDTGANAFGVTQADGRVCVVVNGPVVVELQHRDVDGDFNELVSKLLETPGAHLITGITLEPGRQTLRTAVTITTGTVAIN